MKKSIWLIQLKLRESLNNCFITRIRDIITRNSLIFLLNEFIYFLSSYIFTYIFPLSQDPKLFLFPTDPDSVLCPEVHTDTGWVIIVVANSKTACSKMTHPADYQNAVEEVGRYIVWQSLGVNNLQGRNVLIYQIERPHCHDEVFHSDQWGVSTLAYEGLPMEGLAVILHLIFIVLVFTSVFITKEARVVIGAVRYYAWQRIQNHSWIIR